MILEVLFLSLIAGLATGIGGLVVVFFGKLSNRVVSLSMGFASGVMLLVAFLNLFMESLDLTSYFNASLAFSLGSIIMIIVDSFLPHLELGQKENGIIKSKLVQSSILILIGITIHNIPEGVIVSAGYSHLPQLGVSIAIAVFFHNLPEGIATAIPLTSVMTKRRTVLVTFMSGLSDPWVHF